MGHTEIEHSLQETATAIGLAEMGHPEPRSLSRADGAPVIAADTVPQRESDSRRLSDAVSPRVRIAGKFLYRGGEKLYVRGVTYGAFRPDADGREYTDLHRIDDDFAQMAANGF